MDKKLAGVQEGNRIFRFMIPLTEGEHEIYAEAENCSDTIHIRKVEQENPAYSFRQKGDVINWFDKETFDEECYSLRDTFGELLSNPKSAELVNAIMEKSKSGTR